MNHQSKCIPIEIFGLITAESSDEVLKNIRLTCRAGREIATPLLFQCFRIQAINHHTVKRLREMARRPQLASLVKRFEYQPRIRMFSHNNDERQQMTEQQHLFREPRILIRDLEAALKSFTQLRHVELQYPPFGLRRQSNNHGLSIVASVTRNIHKNMCPRLVSLTIAGLLPGDIPSGHIQFADDGTRVALPPIERLDLDFHPGDMLNVEMVHSRPRLYWTLSAMPNLTFLRIAFHLLDRNMRLLDWSGLKSTGLNTLELVQLEMPGTSLAKIITQNGHSIRQVILESVYLIDGTWAAVYDSIASTEGIIDISEIQGRKYPEDRDSIDTELDAASYRQLFAVVEKRRESQGLPSMRWPISPAGFVYHRDFSYMETG